ncbi:hypothetical protein RBH29_12380 [Herbivorax sp. ANBcel31]|uniref:hypothetical protein n=1 Tax=Herbivorax sp. ANBcel31 TaxID=3069754 RepID=UPI0027B07EBA|nr:hypothetical protein [Herbivorax sp. ANBcel31]MDQ2087224.1 hypothetical protein [Herbivorax sp. ANBcel31]
MIKYKQIITIVLISIFLFTLMSCNPFRPLIQYSTNKIDINEADESLKRWIESLDLKEEGNIYLIKNVEDRKTTVYYVYINGIFEGNHRGTNIRPIQDEGIEILFSAEEPMEALFEITVEDRRMEYFDIRGDKYPIEEIAELDDELDE